MSQLGIACTLWPIHMPYSKGEIYIHTQKRFQIAKVCGPNVHFLDRKSVIWIWILLLHKFHKRVLINKRRLFCFNFIYIFLWCNLMYIFSSSLHKTNLYNQLWFKISHEYKNNFLSRKCKNIFVTKYSLKDGHSKS